MAKLNDNSAYDLSRFEPKAAAQPKPRPEETPGKKKKDENNILTIPQSHYTHVRKVRRRGKNRSAVVKVMVMVAVAAICLVMVLGQVRLAELTQQIESTSKSLTEAESLYTQYQMKSDSQLSLQSVEQYATEQLGMAKADQNQMQYVELSSKDKGEVVQEQGTNWLVSAWNYLVKLLS